MIGSELPVERIVEYLRTLTPDQQAELLVELDRKRLCGEEIPGSSPMVRELRRMVRTSKVGAPRIPSPSRLFFDPVEPFLVGEMTGRPRRGRVARPSLSAIWSWICRDVMPAEAKTYSDRAKNALLAGDMRTSEQLARNFQGRVALLIGRARAVIEGSDEVRERLVACGGPPRALDDLQEILRIFTVRDVLAAATAGLPARLTEFREDAALQAWRTFEPLYAKHRDAWFYALLTLMNRLGAPWQLVRLAIAAAQSSKAIRIAESPYGLAIALVLHDLDDLTGRLRIALASGWSTAVDEMLWDLREAIAGVSTELDFTGETRWSRQLTGIREGVSHHLRAELAVVPERIARVLTLCKAAAAQRATAPAAVEVDAATAGIAFASALEPHAGDFGLSADIGRMRTDASDEIKRATATLVDGVRGGCGLERVNCLLQVAALLAGMLRGKDFAAGLVRAAEAAVAAGRRRI
jgi:hypothetical protein